MKLNHPHSLPQEEAQARVAALCLYWDTKYGTRTQWTGNQAKITGKVRGFKFNGTFSVEPTCLAASVKVSLLAEKIGGSAYVKRKVALYLDPAVPLESLQAKVY